MFFPSLLKKEGVYYAWMKVAGGLQVRHGTNKRLLGSDLDVASSQVARKYEARLALDGAKSGVHLTGEVFPIDIPNDEMLGCKHDILSFSNAQAMQGRRCDPNGAHFLRVSYSVTKRFVLCQILLFIATLCIELSVHFRLCDGSLSTCRHSWECKTCTFRNCWLRTPGKCSMCGRGQFQ